MNTGDKAIWKQATGSGLHALTPARVLEVRPQCVRILVETRRGLARLWVPAASVHLVDDPSAAAVEEQFQQPATVDEPMEG